MSDAPYDKQIEVAIVRLVLVAIGVVLLLFAAAGVMFPPVGLMAVLIGVTGIRLIVSGLTNESPTKGRRVSWIAWRLIIALMFFGAVSRMSEKKLQEAEK